MISEYHAFDHGRDGSLPETGGRQDFFGRRTKNIWNWELDVMSRSAVFKASTAYFLSPIADFLADPSITEIMINRHDQIYIERGGKIYPTQARFESEDALVSAINNVAQWVGRDVSREQPILDARLPDGSRVNVILPPSARGGVCMTIRKFSPGGLRMDDLLKYKSITSQAQEFLRICVELHKNIVISGGTGTGKTSLLGAMSEAVPEVERIVVIEDTSELKLKQTHTVYLEVQKADEYGRGSVTIRELFVASLRMRPDRIIVGEVRGGEALDMVQSMLSGHSGSLTTVHANTPRDAMIRLETLSLMSDVQIPVYVARTQVASAIEIVVQLTRFTADGARKITRITEVEPIDESNEYRFRDLFVYRRPGGDPQATPQLEWTGQKPSFAADLYEHGLGERVEETKEIWGKPGE